MTNKQTKRKRKMRKRYFNQDFKTIIAKFDSICAETGKPLKKGEQILWKPGTREVYSLDSGTATVFRNAKFDEEILMEKNYNN